MITRKNGFLLCCALTLCMITNALAQEAQNKAPAQEKKLEDDPCRYADALIEKGQVAKARAVLEKFVATIPDNWKPLYEENGKTMIICWNSEEFIAYAEYQKESNSSKNAVWPELPSYSHALYLLGFIAVESNDFSGALPYFDKALSLEPDQPTICCEKAFALRQLGRIEEAYQLYQKALEIRPWATTHQRAVALRGAGFALTELDRLDEAEEAYLRSLKLDPNNSIALNELAYIKHRKSGGAKGSSKMLSAVTNVTIE